MARVLPPDVEAWLVTYLRSELATAGRPVEVGNKEPADLQVPLTRPLVVVRDDAGPKSSPVTFDRSVGVSVLGGSRSDDYSTKDLARLVFAILTEDAICQAPASPFAAVSWDGCNGPYTVPEDHDVTRCYMTVEYTAVGTW